ncbi:phage/plasmid primase, P4 family [Nocardioides speluncae]|uniref:phage/plasmid primase, P4 family n=1 Tax=Nocardioides speluncae TaxID=2670337 RepID=UPI000D69E0D6|nr:phage/plasmid primase, P4 family [Nocardioides speluncae]
MTPLKHAEVLAATFGWHVFPLPERSKAAAVKWKEVATADPQAIAGWLNGGPLNYGIACGPSGLVVVDEDETGATSQLARAHGFDELPQTFTVTTAKGRHLYYAASGVPIANSVRRWPGVDVRAVGGYVVGPGSVHESGAVYTVTDARPAQPLPGWLAAALNGGNVIPSTAAAFMSGALDPPAREPVDAAGMVRDGVEPGQQDDQLARLAMSLRARGHDRETAAAIWWSVVERSEVDPARPWTEGDFDRHWSGADRKVTASETQTSVVAPQNGAQEGTPASGAPMLPPPTAPLAVARVVAEDYRHGDRLMLLRWRDSWMLWRTAHWAELEHAAISAQLYRLTEHAVYLKDGKPTPWAMNRRKLGDVLDALGAVTLLPAEHDAPTWLDGTEHGVLVACANGLLDVGTRQLYPHDPTYFNVVSVPFAYDAAAPAPAAWLAFLAQLWPDDPDAIAALQEWFGYVLSGRTHLQKILMIVGPKRSGKGTIARVLQGLVGRGNHIGPTMASLSTNFGLESWLGKPLAVISDARLGSRHDPHVVVERLLSISGEDALTVDRKHRQGWTGRLPTRVMVLSNELPRFSDASGAIATRFVVLTQTVSWLGREDTDLEAKLVAELPGILNWALDGLARLTDRGRLTEPASSTDSVIAMGDSASPMSAFVRDECTVGAGLEVTPEQFFAAWRGWCLRNGRDHHGTLQTAVRDLHAVVPAIRTVRPRHVDGSRPRILRGIMLGPRWSAVPSIAGYNTDESQGQTLGIGGNGVDRGPSRTTLAAGSPAPAYCRGVPCRRLGHPACSVGCLDGHAQ